MGQDEATPPPFPLAKVIGAMMVNFGNTASYLISIPFVGFMVSTFYPSLGLHEVGYYSGLLEGAFHIGAVFGSLFWSAFSERFGRRPAVLIGLVGSTVAALSFGFAPTFPLAMAARFMWGLLNGNIGVVKTMISDVCPDEHTARAFSFIGIGAGLGRVVGPTIGGLFSEPAKKYPLWFGESSPFVAFPFALPCTIGAALSFCILLVSYFVLEETRGLAIAEQREIELRIKAALSLRRGSQGHAELVNTSTNHASRLAPPAGAGCPSSSVTTDGSKVCDGMSRSSTNNSPTCDASDRSSSSVEIPVVVPFASDESGDSEDDETCLISSSDTAALTSNTQSISTGVGNTTTEPSHSLRPPLTSVVTAATVVDNVPAADNMPASEGLNVGHPCCSQMCRSSSWCRLLGDPVVLMSTALYAGLGGIAIVSVEITSLQVRLIPPTVNFT